MSETTAAGSTRDASEGEGRTQEHDLAGLIMMTARRLRHARMEALRPYGLTPQQAAAFLIVARHSRGGPHGGHVGHGGHRGHSWRSGHHGRAGFAEHAGQAEHAGTAEPEEPGELRLSDLARRLRIAPRSVTEVVDALCEKDLVARRPSPTDRRATIVALTDGGERLHSDLAERRDGAPDLFAPLTDEEQDHLRALLRRLHDGAERC